VAATDGDAPPGLINPTIYPLALGSSYHTLFHDITSGNNGFPATAGYDLDSGWGSPNGSALINALAAP
jgi:xanthomonalisin